MDKEKILRAALDRLDRANDFVCMVWMATNDSRASDFFDETARFLRETNEALGPQEKGREA